MPNPGHHVSDIENGDGEGQAGHVLPVSDVLRQCDVGAAAVIPEASVPPRKADSENGAEGIAAVVLGSDSNHPQDSFKKPLQSLFKFSTRDVT